MPDSWITKSDGAEIRLAHPVNRAGMLAGDRERSYDLVNDPSFQDVDKTKVALILKDVVQEDLTFRQNVRDDVPSDDSDKTVDPARGEKLFWEGNGAKRELVSRTTIVESCVWDGVRFVFRLRRAR